MRTFGWTMAFAAVGTGLLVLGVADRAPGAAPSAEGGQMPALEVSTAPVVKQTVPVYLEYVATTEAIRSVTLQSKVNGYIVQRGAADGADVKEGDLLYRIDPRDYQAALELSVAQARHEAAARDYARSRQSRSATLAQDGWASKDTFEQTASAVRQAEANLAAAEAAIQTARLNLAYTEIRAPFAGRLSRSLVHEGAFIAAAAGTALNTLVQLDPIRVTFSPSERDLAAIVRSRAAGDVPVEVLLPAAAHATHFGTLSFLDNKVDRTTGTIVAQGKIGNPDLTLLPGQYVRVRVRIDARPDALLVPGIAVGSSQLGKFVYVVGDENTVEQRYVSVGTGVGELVVIDKGVSEGETVIIDNLQKIGPGAPVRPKATPSAG